MKNRTRPYAHYKFPDEIIITVKPMSDSDCSWFNAPQGSFELRTSNYGWFPTEVIAKTKNGRYFDYYEYKVY